VCFYVLVAREVEILISTRSRMSVMYLTSLFGVCYCYVGMVLSPQLFLGHGVLRSASVFLGLVWMGHIDGARGIVYIPNFFDSYLG
jgi:hypothetical protein